MAEFGEGVKFLVVAEYTCPECKGERWFYSPLWEGANAAFDKAWDEQMKAEAGAEAGSEEEQEAYYRAGNAAGEAMDQYWRDHYYSPRGKLPPEEEPCGECEGAGIIRRKVDLREALEALRQEVSGE